MSQYLLFFLAAYLVGCIPTGAIAAKLRKNASIIEPGTRSTIRPGEIFEILGFPLGIFVMILDNVKGIFTVLVLPKILLEPQYVSIWWIISLGVALTVIGHCNSALLGFKGGRGLAPIFGAMLIIFPIPTIFAGSIGFFWGFWGLSTKPGALSAAGLLPIGSIAWVLIHHPEQLNYLYLVAFLSLWTMWEHRDELKSYMGIKSKSNKEPTIISSPNETNSEEQIKA